MSDIKLAKAGVQMAAAADEESDNLSNESEGYESEEDLAVKKVPIPADLRPWKEDKRVVQFLVKIGEARNARRIFDENEVDFETLMILNDEMLADMGIKLSSREKILLAIGKIKEQEADDKLALYDDDADVDRAVEEEDHRDEETGEIVEMLSSAKAKDLSAGLKRVRQIAQVDPNLLNRSAIVNALLAVLNSGSSFPSLGKAQKEALGIVYLLSKVDANKLLLAKGGCIGYLAQILAVASDERNTKTALLSLRTVQELILIPNNLRQVRETSGVPRSLLALVQLRAPGVQEAALEVLFTLAYENLMIQAELMKPSSPTDQSSAIDILGRIIVRSEGESPKVKGLAARTIGVLASGPVPNAMVQARISPLLIDIFIQMATSADEYQQMGGATAIGFMCDCNVDKKKIVLEKNAIEHMVQLLSSANVDVQQAAARAVRGLCRTNKNQPKLGKLNKTKKGNKVEVQIHAILYNSGAVLSLASLLHSGKKAMREDALSAIFELSKVDPVVQEQVFQAVNAPPIVEALSDSSVNIQYYALGILWFMVQGNPPRGHSFLRAGVLEPLNRLQASQNKQINHGAVACFIELQKSGAELLNYSSYVTR